MRLQVRRGAFSRCPLRWTPARGSCAAACVGGGPDGGARSPEQLEGMFLANHRGFSSRPLTVGWLGKYSPCHRICSETVRTILRYVLVMCCNEEVNSRDDEVIYAPAPGVATFSSPVLAFLFPTAWRVVTGPLKLSAVNWANVSGSGRAGNNRWQSQWPSSALVTGSSRGC